MDETRIRLINLVLTRIPLSAGQLALFKVLYEKDDQWISKSELAYRIRDNHEEGVTGILGALGNRINQTAGVQVPLDGIGLLMRLDSFHDENHYRILPELRTTIDNFPVLQQVMQLSIDEIYEKYSDGFTVR